MKIFITDPGAKYANTAVTAASATYADAVSNCNFAYEAGHAAHASHAAHVSYADQTDFTESLQCCSAVIAHELAEPLTKEYITDTVYSSELKIWNTSNHHNDYTNNKNMSVEYLWVTPYDYYDSETTYSYKDYKHINGVGGMYTTIVATGSTTRTISPNDRTNFWKFSYVYDLESDNVSKSYCDIFNIGEIIRFTFDVYAYGRPNLGPLYLNTDIGSAYSNMLITSKNENKYCSTKQTCKYICSSYSIVTNYPISNYLLENTENNNTTEITPAFMIYNSAKIKRKIKCNKKYFCADSNDSCELYYRSHNKETIWIINEIPYFIKNDANNLSHISLYSKIKQKFNIYIIDDIYDVPVMEVYAI